MSLSAGTIIDQVRQKLRLDGIKLWLEPYYFEGIGSIEKEIDNLARQFENSLGISFTDCKLAIVELQDGALEKLKARNQLVPSGEVTFKARVIKTSNKNEKFKVIELKHSLSVLGEELYNSAAELLKCNENDLKIIFAGKVLRKETSLFSQGIKANLQAIIFVSEDKNESSNIHERVKKAKDDAMLVLSSENQQFMTMEDQDGNLVHLPPNERDSLILALALYEKGRSALKKNLFDEALIFFLEADELFSACKSEMLDRIDNYALLNLDIVWCYLCLKSFSYLPDADRRLRLCEESFNKSYGSDMNRLTQLKGEKIRNEQALLMRLNLLQGVLLYHQNRHDDAYMKFLKVEEEMLRLDIDEEKLMNMLDMGYDLSESRIALRACFNNVEEAINFITDRRIKKKEARKRGRKESELNKNLKKFEDGEEWINPKSVLTLVEMGFPTEIAAVALRKSKNDLPQAIEMIQNNIDALRAEIPKTKPDSVLVEQLRGFGFPKEMIEMALRTHLNNPDEAVDFLLQLQSDENLDNLEKIIDQLGSDLYSMNKNESSHQILSAQSSTQNLPGPSSSRRPRNIIKVVKEKIKKQKEAKEAYDRFVEDVSIHEDEYLDINFEQEKNILQEYKNFLIR